MSETTLTDEMFLLLTAESGRQEHTMYRRYAVSAAAICELVLRERISLSEDRDPRVSVLDASPLGDPALDRALVAIAEAGDGKRASKLITAKGLDLTQAVGAALVERGVLTEKSGLLGTSWPITDAAPKAAARSRLAAAVADPASASIRDAVALGILKATQVGYVAIREDLEQVGRGETLKRIDALAEATPVVGVLHMLRDHFAMQQTAASTGFVAG